MYSYIELKKYHAKYKNTEPISYNLRIHRSLSWLSKAEQENDLDVKFILLWISFNAAYAQRINSKANITEKKVFYSFVSTIVFYDKDKLIDDYLWKSYSGPIRLLLKNKYIFDKFWLYQEGEISDDVYKEFFEKANKEAIKALETQDTTTILAILLRRIWTLRNQILHGGSTWNSKINRSQINDATRILSHLVPIILEIMISNPSIKWPEGIYPPVDKI